MKDNRIERCRALFDWYERHGLPEDGQTVVNAVSAIVTGEIPEQNEESVEERLETLEAVVTKLLRAQEPTENSAPSKPPSRFKKLYCDIDNFRELMIDEAEKTASERDQILFQNIADALDKILEDTE